MLGGRTRTRRGAVRCRAVQTAPSASLHFTLNSLRLGTHTQDTHVTEMSSHGLRMNMCVVSYPLKTGSLYFCQDERFYRQRVFDSFSIFRLLQSYAMTGLVLIRGGRGGGSGRRLGYDALTFCYGEYWFNNNNRNV